MINDWLIFALRQTKNLYFLLISFICFSFWLLACQTHDTNNSNNETSCADSCSGCCVKGECQPFDDQTDNLCGTDGNNCKACSSGTTCIEGVCQTTNPTTCNATTCPNGCCELNTNTCIVPQTNQSCGKNGVTCADCTAYSWICDTTTGACQPSSSTVKCQITMGGHGSNLCKGTNTNGNWLEDRCSNGVLEKYTCATDGSELCIQTKENCSTGLCDGEIEGHSHKCGVSASCKIEQSNHNVNCCRGTNTGKDCYEDRCNNGVLITHSCAADGSCVQNNQSCPSGQCGNMQDDHYHSCGAPTTCSVGFNADFTGFGCTGANTNGFKEDWCQNGVLHRYRCAEDESNNCTETLVTCPSGACSVTQEGHSHACLPAGASDCTIYLKNNIYCCQGANTGGVCLDQTCSTGIIKFYECAQDGKNCVQNFYYCPSGFCAEPSAGQTQSYWCGYY